MKKGYHGSKPVGRANRPVVGHLKGGRMKDEHEHIEIPETLPLLPIRDVVIYPYMILPLFVGRTASINAVNEALRKDRLMFLAAQKDMDEENPSPDNIYRVGCVGMIMRMNKLPDDGKIKILVQGLAKAKIIDFVQESPSFQVKIGKLDEPIADSADLEIEATIRNVKENLERIVSLGKVLSPDILVVLDDISDPGRLADLVASNLGLKVKDAQEVLEILHPKDRLFKVNELLNREIEVLSMQAKIQSQAKEEMSKTQREYYLREQLRAIKTELGDTDNKADEVEEFRARIDKCKLPEDADKEVKKQLRRLETMHADAAEATIVRTYLDWVCDLPWATFTKDNLDINRARKILDDDHYGLNKIKERILDHLGVCKIKKELKGPILCFVGPPGVGKTSLGKSIARTLGRKFIRMSMGGIKDEAELRGHRRTYVGAMPGRILQGLKIVGTKNPLFMLDEVDKLGADYRGDPASALLEILDPEQNNNFRDHYLGMPFDLSKVMFICTANLVDPIPEPLRDRMEIITIDGYTQDEKANIAEKFLVPKQITENGLKPKDISYGQHVIDKIITGYTREAGVRNLEREISTLCRKVARRRAEGNRKRLVVTTKNLDHFLGQSKFRDEDERKENEIGVVTGLAWTRYGGTTLMIEAGLHKGKGNFTLTGQLGDVMKESAQAALTYARSKAEKLGLSRDFFSEHNIHIHIPAGATPKDGPSAGITIATALVSLISKVPVSAKLAMTGEITLLGKILAVGGIKEKVLAAAQSNLSLIIMPEANRKDLEELPKSLLKKMHFVFVKHMDEVLQHALVENPFQKKRLKKGGGGSSQKKKPPLRKPSRLVDQITAS